MHRFARFTAALTIVGGALLGTMAPSAHASAATCKVTRSTLRQGDTGGQVRCLQEAINAHYHRAIDDPDLIAVDGIFGAGTRRAVIRFQRDRRLVADGIAGARTLGALGIRMVQPTEHGFPSITAGRIAVERYIERTDTTLLRGARMRTAMAAARADLERTIGWSSYSLLRCSPDTTCLLGADGHVMYLEVSFVRSTDGSWAFGSVALLAD